jgi:uncharacterized protein (TIGR03083 family)
MIDTRPLFRPLHGELVGLLRGLLPGEWEAQTICPAWKVRDVAAHLLDTTLRRLSFGRDAMPPPPPERPIAGYADLVAFLDGLNADWVRASRRLSPRVLIDLLAVTGPQIADFFDALDPGAQALFGVSWAGEEESENWFDVGREYTEQWLHQQHIRLATGRQLLRERRWMHPVLALFVRAVPRAYQEVEAPEGTVVRLTLEGEAGGGWDLVRGRSGWHLEEEGRAEPATAITMRDEDAWLLFSKGLRGAAAEERVRTEGDQTLGKPFLGTLAIMG